MNESSSSPDLVNALRKLESQVAQLQSEVVDLRQQLRHEPLAIARDTESGSSFGRSSPPDFVAECEQRTDRRSMLKKVGAMAAGVATAGLLRPSSSKAAGRFIGKENNMSPDASGGNFILGRSNIPSDTDTTSLIAPGSVVVPALLRVDNYTTGSLPVPPSGRTAGLFHITNQNGTPTTGNFYAVYASAVAPAGGTPIGVHADGTFTGVEAVSVAGAAVRATSTTGIAGSFINGNTNYCLFLSGGLGHLHLNSNGVTENPLATANAYASGVIIKTTDLSLWYSVGAGTPGDWRKLAGPATAGAAHLLSTPVRYVDTRNGTGGFNTPFPANSARPFNFTTLQPGTIPTKARGIFGNITAANPAGNGNLQTNTANSFPSGSAAVMSYRTGVNLSNHFVSALDESGVMFVRANLASAHVIIDIQGYYI